MPVGGTTHTHIRGIVVLRRVVVIIYNNNIIIASAIKRVHTGWSPGSVRDVKYGRPCARASTAGRTGFTVFFALCSPPSQRRVMAAEQAHGGTKRPPVFVDGR